jgi:hypothetical protein
MSSLSLTKKLILAAFAVVGLYGLLIGGWAFRSMSDSVPVGMDWSPTVASPPRGQQAVSQRVSCNNLFASSAVDGPLPTLTPQPKDRPALAFQRPPCQLVQHDAIWVLTLDTIFAAMILAAIALLLARRRQPSVADVPAIAPA